MAVAFSPRAKPRGERQQEFSLNQIWSSPGSAEAVTGHKLVTALGGARTRPHAFKKPLLIPLFFDARRAHSSRSESPQEVAEEAEVSSPLSNVVGTLPHFPRSVLSPGRLQSLHRRATKPCDFSSVVHTDPGRSESPDLDQSNKRPTITSETPYNPDIQWELPHSLSDAKSQDFPFEESLKSRMDASLDFGEKPCLAYCSLCNKETRTVVRQDSRKCTDAKGLSDFLTAVNCCLSSSRRKVSVHYCGNCEAVLARF